VRVTEPSLSHEVVLRWNHPIGGKGAMIRSVLSLWCPDSPHRQGHVRIVVVEWYFVHDVLKPVGMIPRYVIIL